MTATRPAAPTAPNSASPGREKVFAPECHSETSVGLSSYGGGSKTRSGKEFPEPLLFSGLLSQALPVRLRCLPEAASHAEYFGRSAVMAGTENRQKKDGVSGEFIPLTFSPGRIRRQARVQKAKAFLTCFGAQGFDAVW